MTTITIQWTPDLGGRPALVAVDDCGNDKLIVEHDDPIAATTDSHSIAAMFNWPRPISSVDHDGEYIHVTLAD